MDLSNASVWWIAAGVAVAAELATGTFYLLMIALGLGAGALAAHFGSTQPIQLLVAARRRRRRDGALALAPRLARRAGAADGAGPRRQPRHRRARPRPGVGRATARRG